MCEQNVSYLAKHSKLGSKKFKRNLCENYSKSTKIASIPCKFSGEACPRTPRELFLYFNQLQISSVEKKTLEKSGNYALPPFPLSQFLATPLPALVVSEENLVIGFGPSHFSNASAIAGQTNNCKIGIHRFLA